MNEQEKRVSFHPLGRGFTVKGPFLSCWEANGGEHGPLGYPLGEQEVDRTGAGHQRFQGGCICYHPEAGAHPLLGKFYLWWADHLGVHGPYGYPLGAAEQQAEGLIQRFQGGTIRDWDPWIRDQVDLRGEIARREIVVRNQGVRGTCSVQVMVFLLEYQYTGMLGRDWRHLSVEYANHLANVVTGDRDDGHCFDRMEAAYNQYGTIPDWMWPYNKDWVYDYEQAQALVTEEMLSRGKLALSDGLRLKGRYIKELDGNAGLSDEQMKEILALLDAGVPVGVGRQHSLVLVGYRRDAAALGGGILLLRNSYGTTPTFTGYQTETFAHVQETANDVYVYQRET